MRRHFIAGLLIWVPLGVTVIALRFVVDLFDRLFLFLPMQWRPETFLGMAIPGAGFILSLVVIYLTGLIVSNFIGRRLVGTAEKIVEGVPFVSTFYKGVKQMTEAIFSSGTQSFDKVFLIEYPRKGLWTIAFQTSRKKGQPQEIIIDREGDDKVVNLFVPTTPNPTSGYFIMVSEQHIIELDMSVDDALKMIVSGGIYVPSEEVAGTASR